MTKEPTLIEYENIIEDLMKENESLKKRIVKLEEQIKLYKEPQYTVQEITTPKIEERTSEPPILKTDVIVSKSFFSQDTVPLEMGKGPIIQGVSRRECPICGNRNKLLIHEVIDRTHIISAYPRMYGKKYKCGECGREWRLSVEM